MTTPAFDALWDGPKTPSSFDALWDSGAPKTTVPKVAADATSALPRNRPDVSGDLQSAKSAIPAALGALTSATPGFLRPIQTEARALVRGQSYPEAYKDIQGAEKASGPVGKVTSLLGSAVAAGALPGSPAVQGGIFGGLEGVANPDPNSDVGDRIKKGVLGAGLGALAGKATDLGTTAIRAKLAPEPTANLAGRAAARTEASAPLYNDFRNLGDLGRTPKLDALLGAPASPIAGGAPATDGLPIIRRAIDAVKGESPVLAKLPDTDARVLDAVYKRVGNKAFIATHGFEPGEARAALLDAIDEAAQAKGGSYAAPVAAYREGSQGINAVTRGRNAVQNAISKSGGSEKAALEKSPAAFSQWLDTASPSLVQDASQGVLGQTGRNGTVSVGRAFGVPIFPHPSPSLHAASALMRGIDDQSGNNVPAMLRALGIVGATAPVQP